MTFGSLFTGIGGLDLGLERAGHECLWQVEIDEWCRRQLRRNWPKMPGWDDVATFTGEGFERPDAIVGGFPCQDVSSAGARAGIDGERSGLWREFERIIRILRPRYVLVENVTGLLVPRREEQVYIDQAAIGRVLGDLSSLGFDAEWHTIPAAAVGAPHIRDRVFIYAHDDRMPVRGEGHGKVATTTRKAAKGPKGRQRIQPHVEPVLCDATIRADATGGGMEGRAIPAGRRQKVQGAADVDGLAERVDANAEGERCRSRAKEARGQEGQRRKAGQPDRSATCKPSAIANALRDRLEGIDTDGPAEGPIVRTPCWWDHQPRIRPMVHGVPRRLVQSPIQAFGNAVVPQVAEIIGEAIGEWIKARERT